MVEAAAAAASNARGAEVIGAAHTLHGFRVRRTALCSTVSVEDGRAHLARFPWHMCVPTHHGCRDSCLHGNRGRYLHGCRATKDNPQRTTHRGQPRRRAHSCKTHLVTSTEPAQVVTEVGYVSRVPRPRANSQRWPIRVAAQQQGGPRSVVGQAPGHGVLRPSVNAGALTGAPWGGCARRAAVATLGAIQPLRHGARPVAAQRWLAACRHARRCAA